MMRMTLSIMYAYLQATHDVRRVYESLTGVVDPRHVFQELVQGLGSIAPEEVELVYEHLCRLVRDGRSGDG